MLAYVYLRDQESQTWETTDTFEHSYDLSIKVSGKFPKSTMGLSLEVEAQGHWAWGSVKAEKKTEEKTRVVRDEREVKVPPHRKVMAAVSVTQAVIDVPFEARMTLVLIDNTPFTYTIQGTYRSVTVSSQKHHVKEVDITEEYPLLF